MARLLGLIGLAALQLLADDLRWGGRTLWVSTVVHIFERVRYLGVGSACARARTHTHTHTHTHLLELIAQILVVNKTGSKVNKRN